MNATRPRGCRPSDLCLRLLMLAVFASLVPASVSAGRRRPPTLHPPEIVRIGAQRADGPSSAIFTRYGFTAVQPVALPPFSLADARGQKHGPGDFSGRWFLLNVFATWCGPCAAEMPALQRLARVAPVLAVATRSPEGVAAFVARLHLTLAVVHDGDDQLGSLLQVRTYPTTFLVNPAGEVEAMAVGTRHWQRVAPMFARLARQP